MLNLVSVSLIVVWAFLVGRICAFGHRSTKVYTWIPLFSSTSWYNLTPIYLRLPKIIIRHLHGIVAISSGFYLLLSDHLFLQSAMIFLMISLHTYIPIFVIHLHSDSTLFVWSLLNIIIIIGIMIGTLSLQLVTATIAICTTLPVCSLIFWFIAIQLQLVTCLTVLQQPMTDLKRQPRMV